MTALVIDEKTKIQDIIGLCTGDYISLKGKTVMVKDVKISIAKCEVTIVTNDFVYVRSLIVDFQNELREKVNRSLGAELSTKKTPSKICPKTGWDGEKFHTIPFKSSTMTNKDDELLKTKKPQQQNDVIKELLDGVLRLGIFDKPTKKPSHESIGRTDGQTTNPNEVSFILDEDSKVHHVHRYVPQDDVFLVYPDGMTYDNWLAIAKVTGKRFLVPKHVYTIPPQFPRSNNAE